MGERLRPKQTDLADFYFKRFRPEFKPAVNAWIATRPLKNADAPPTPFAMPQYKLAARAQAERLEAQAEVYAAGCCGNIQRASNYVLAVVLFASALFFAGMSTKLAAPKLRVAMLTIGCVVFLVTAVWIATSPVNVTVSGPGGQRRRSAPVEQALELAHVSSITQRLLYHVYALLLQVPRLPRSPSPSAGRRLAGRPVAGSTGLHRQ